MSAEKPSQGLVVLSTGGTGGHVFPAEALAAELAARGHRLAVVTDRRGEAIAGPLGALDSYQIKAAGISGRGWSARAGAVIQLGLGFFQARGLLKSMRPDVVVGFGGYPSVPTMFAASRLRLRTLVHEQNAVLGRANRLLAPRVDRIATSFENTSELRSADAPKSTWTGNPVRPDIAALSGRPYPPTTAEGRLNVLVVGGSQGAAVFGEVIPQTIASLPEPLRARVSVAQQVRPEQIPTVEQVYAAAGVNADIRTFFNDMPDRLAAAHLLVGRAGASTIAEVTAVGRPAILVPYPHAIDDHQAANAARLADASGAWTYPQEAFTPNALAERFVAVLENPGTLETAARCSARIGMPQATSRLADLVEGLMAGNGARSASRSSTTQEVAA